MSLNPPYEVVSPAGKQPTRRINPAKGLPSLEGKSVGLVWNSFTNGEILADAIASSLRRKYQAINLIKLPSGKELQWGDSPDESVGAASRQAGVDAVIVSVGG